VVDSRTAIVAFARRARRRLALVRSVYWAQRALFAALWLAVAVIAFERLTGLWIPPAWAIPTAACGVVLLAAAIAYWVPRRGLLSAAAEADAQAGWKEALSSAIALGDPKESMEIALLEDARNRAKNARPAALFPLRAPPELRWMFAPAVLVIAALFLPRLDLLGVEAEAKKEEQKKSQFQKVVEKLEKNREKLAKGEKVERPAMVAVEAMRELERLQEELGKNPMERKQAMAELSRAEEKLRDLQKELADSRELAARLQKAMEKQGEDAGELGKKIKQGKFDEAADELAKLRNKMQEGKLTEGEKRELSEKLEALQSRLGDDKNLDKFEKAISKALEGLGENREMDFEEFQDALQELDGDMAQLEALEDVLREMQGMKEDLAKGEEGEEGT
jgi:DNA repair exonuclease SbcCD ATPase subunit